jgi:hypothetical protein
MAVFGQIRMSLYKQLLNELFFSPSRRAAASVDAPTA